MDYKQKSEEMVRLIKDRYGLKSPKVASVMLRIPRHSFVEKKYWDVAYDDGPVPIGLGQTMSQPYTVAMMTHLLISAKNTEHRTKDKRVLEIGTGSGYQAAVLSKLFDEVYTIEIVAELASRARKLLKKLNLLNINVKQGSGEWGWKEKSPFDAILISAAVEGKIPEELREQLKVGGVIVAPIGPRWSQTMTRFTKLQNGRLEKEEFEKYVFVPFVEEGD